MPDAPRSNASRSNSADSIALAAPATRHAVEDALAQLEPVATTLLRDRYLGAGPPAEGAVSEAAQKTEAAALSHLAAALDNVAPAPDGTPWQVGSARALLRMVGAGMRLDGSRPS
ncbi:MAG: hypothetical protein AAFQ53_10370 [Bacteroidota bacterium]